MTDSLIVIAGPTASGKTRLAIEIARKIDAEILSADSQQVYRHFDIGTAKPSAEELAAVPHHLISCVDPKDAFSAARYQALADAKITEIRSRFKRVVVVGGTGLYLRVLLHGVVDAPGSDAELRAQLELLDSVSLHARLNEVDPVSAARLHVNDRVRLIRAIEIHTLTGVAASQTRTDHGFVAERYPYRLWVLSPPREPLYQTINARTRAMFDGGLVDEARALIDRGFRDAAPMRSVGYSQAVDHLEGRLTFQEAIVQTAQATRHYAKRQMTWFKKEQGANFIEPPYDSLEL